MSDLIETVARAIEPDAWEIAENPEYTSDVRRDARVGQTIARALARIAITATIDWLAEQMEQRVMYLNASRYSVEGMSWRDALNEESSLRQALIWLRAQMPEGVTHE